MASVGFGSLPDTEEQATGLSTVSTGCSMKQQDVSRTESDPVDSVRRWVETLVVGQNLCPFARRELVNNRVRFALTTAATEEQLLAALVSELGLLETDPTIETTLLIHPDVLQHFSDYNQFLDNVDALLVAMEWEGVYQIASFHPDYRFAGTEPGDVENFTNRSPYPLLHVLRESSLERAIAGYRNVDQIPEKNIALMRELGKSRLASLLKSCIRPADD